MLLLFFEPFTASCEEKKIITSITPEQVKNIGESAELNCTVENPNDYSVLWSKKSRDRPSDPMVLSIGEHLTIKDSRFKLTTNNVTFTLHVS